MSPYWLKMIRMNPSGSKGLIRPKVTFGPHTGPLRTCPSFAVVSFAASQSPGWSSSFRSSRHYGLTGGLPGSAAPRERATGAIKARTRRCFPARADAELYAVSGVQAGSCRGRGAVRWKACQSLLALMQSDSERLCHVPRLLAQ